MRSKEFLGVMSLTAIGNLSNLLFTVVCLRVLTSEQYGLFASVLYVITLVALGASGFQTLGAVDTSNHILNRRSGARIPYTHDSRIKSLFGATLIVSTTLMVFLISDLNPESSPLRSYAPVGFYVGAACIFSLSLGRLQGSNMMMKATLAGTISNIVKLVIVIPFLFIESNAFQLLMAIAFSAYVGVAISLFMSKDLGAVPVFGTTSQAIKIGTLGVLFWASNGIDVLFVRFAMNAEQAGQYSQIATISRLCLIPLIFATQKDFPKMIKQGKVQNSFLYESYKIASQSLMFMFGAALGFAFFGDLIFDFLVDNSLPNAGILACLYVIALMPLSLALPLLQGATTKPRNRVVAAMLSCLVAGIIIVMYVPNTAIELIGVVFMINLSVLATLIVLDRQLRVIK